jgi:LexA DNA binding domain
MWMPVTPISERQQQVLDLLVTEFGGRILASACNYRRIADAVGWKNSSGVRDCLFILRAKGAIKSVGLMQTKPDSWTVT